MEGCVELCLCEGVWCAEVVDDERDGLGGRLHGWRMRLEVCGVCGVGVCGVCGGVGCVGVCGVPRSSEMSVTGSAAAGCTGGGRAGGACADQLPSACSWISLHSLASRGDVSTSWKYLRGHDVTSISRCDISANLYREVYI